MEPTIPLFGNNDIDIDTDMDQNNWKEKLNKVGIDDAEKSLVHPVYDVRVLITIIFTFK